MIVRRNKTYIKYLLISFVILVLFSFGAFAQRIDLIEIDFHSDILYYLYHYEPNLLTMQIFGSPDYDTLGFAIGPYINIGDFKIEALGGPEFNTSAPIEQHYWHAKLNWFADLTISDNKKIQFISINDFAFGINNIPDKLFNRLDVTFETKSKIDFGLRIQNLNFDWEKFTPNVGILNKIEIGESLWFLLYVAKNIEKIGWYMELDIFYLHIGD